LRERGRGEMAGVLEAMGFPRDWCERAMGISGGIEPAVELLLQWQAEGAPPGGGADPPASPTMSSPPAASTVTSTASESLAGLDAVVPDAGIVARNCRPETPERSKKVGVPSLNRKIPPPGSPCGEYHLLSACISSKFDVLLFFRCRFLDTASLPILANMVLEI
jgi:hypothetical protein